MNLKGIQGTLEGMGITGWTMVGDTVAIHGTDLTIANDGRYTTVIRIVDGKQQFSPELETENALTAQLTRWV